MKRSISPGSSSRLFSVRVFLPQATVRANRNVPMRVPPGKTKHHCRAATLSAGQLFAADGRVIRNLIGILVSG